MRLYHRWACPWCAAARQGVANVGVDVELVIVPRPRRERTELIELSGQDRIPVLVDGDEVIVGSRSVVRHLYRRYGGPDLANSAADLEVEEQVLADAGLGTSPAGARGPSSADD